MNRALPRPTELGRREISVLVACLIAGVGLAAAPVALGGAAAVGLLVVLATLYWPGWGLFALVFAVPFGDFAGIRLGEVALSVSDALIPLVLLALILRLALRQDRGLRILPLTLPVGLWIAVLGISASLTPDETLALGLKEVAKWAEFAMVYFATAHLARPLPSLRALTFTILLAAAAVAAVGWAQFFLRLGPGGYQFGPFLRAYGTFGQPNPFAGYLGMTLLLGYGLLLTTRRARLGQLLLPWLITVGLLGVIAVAIFMSLSRGAWLGIVLAAAIVSVIRTRRALMPILAGVMLLVLVGLLGVFSLLPPSVSERAVQWVEYFGVFDVQTVQVTDDNWAIVERMANWQAAWDMFEKNPNTGVGLGAYASVYRNYAIGTWQAFPSEHAHNFYLFVLAEMGWPGGLAYALLVLATLIYVAAVLRRVARSRTLRGGDRLLFDYRYAVALGGLGAIIVLHIHNTFDNLYVHGILVQVALILGLISAADAEPALEPQEAPS